MFAVFICMIIFFFGMVNLKATSNAFIRTHAGTIQWLPDESEDMNKYVCPLLCSLDAVALKMKGLLLISVAFGIKSKYEAGIIIHNAVEGSIMSLVWRGNAARERMNLLRPSIKKHCVFSKDNSSIFGKLARSLERDAEPRNLLPKEA